MPDFEIDVSYAGDREDIVILSVSGSLVMETAPGLEKKIEEQLALKKYKFIINLENADFVASAGWGVCVGELKTIRENGGDIVLANMSPDVFEVYQVMDFSSILKSFESLDEAIACFSGESKAEHNTSKLVSLKPQPTPKPDAVKSQIPEKEAGKQEAAPRPGPSAGPEQAPAPEKKPVIDSIATNEPQKRIIRVILENPHLESKEISRALKLPHYGGKKISVKKIKKELEAMGLSERQKRIELAMKSRE
jgi:anti-sigma B factor antagonist